MPNLTPYLNAPPALVEPWTLYTECLKPSSQRAAREAIGAFAAWQDASPVDCLREWLSASQGEQYAVSMAWRAAMLAAGIAPATINQRLWALQIAVREANRRGWCQHTVDLPRIKINRRREPKSRDTATVQQLLLRLEAQAAQSEKAARAYLAVRLASDLALRRAEIHRLQLSDWTPNDPPNGALAVWEKGGNESEKRCVLLPSITANALAIYLAWRGPEPGALLLGDSGRRAVPETRINDLIAWACRSVGMLLINPHAFRHSTLTRAWRGGATMEQMQALSRHKDPSTLACYVSTTKNSALQTAQKVLDQTAEMPERGTK